MAGELNRTDQWSEFMSRMRNEFEKLIESKPACVQDIVRELRKHDDSITFLDAIGDSIPEVKDVDPQVLPAQMQHHGYYASLQGPWLVCSKSKSSTILCSLQPKQLRCLPKPI